MVSSRLFEFAKVLGVPVSHFFEEMLPEVAHGKHKRGRPTTEATNDTSINTKRETLKLIRAYYKIRNEGVRRQIRGMIQALSGPARSYTRRGASRR